MTNKPKPEQNAEILQLIRGGIPYSRIGALYGISRQRVYYLARKAGIPRRDPSKARQPKRPTLANIKAGMDLLIEAIDSLPPDKVTARLMAIAFREWMHGNSGPTISDLETVLSRTIENLTVDHRDNPEGWHPAWK